MRDGMRDRLHALLSQAEHLQSEVTLTCSELLTQMQADGGNVNEAVYTDCGYLLRSIEDAVDEARKECKAKKELLGRALAFAVITRVTERPSSEVQSVGLMAYGTPDVKQKAALPKPGTDAHRALMTHFGVNNQDVEKFGILAFHWPSVSDYLTALAADGKNPPAGLGTLHPEYTVSYRKRKT